MFSKGTLLMEVACHYLNIGQPQQAEIHRLEECINQVKNRVAVGEVVAEVGETGRYICMGAAQNT